MDNFITHATETAILQIVQVTLLILLVGVITRLACRNRPYTALVLWSIVLLKCLLPPLVYSPCGAFRWLEPISSTPPASTRTWQVSVVAPTEPQNAVSQRVSGRDECLRTNQPKPQNASRGPTNLTRAGRSQIANVNWASVSFMAWLAGAVALLVIYAIRCHLFLRHIRQERWRIQPTEQFHTVERIIQRLAPRIGLRRVPQLVLSGDNVGPAVFGLWHSTVVLPSALVQQCSTRQLTPIILHELLHVRRGDLWLALYCTMVRVVWWFHPLVWWSVRQTESESERCCDESVVAYMYRDPTRYAHSLINALEQSHQLTTPSLVPGIRPVDITAHRLERIMRLGQGSRSRMPLGGWVLAVVASALVLPGASGGLAQSPDADKKPHQNEDTAEPWRANAPASTTRLDRNVQPASHETRLEADSSVFTWQGTAHVHRQVNGTSTVRASGFFRSYEVGDLLAKMQHDENWPEDTPEEQLKRSLVHWFKQFALRPETIPAAKEEHTARADEKPPASLQSQTRFAWRGTRLTVSGPREAHERLLREINTRRKHSFKQVSVEVRFMQGAAHLCRPTDPAALMEADDNAPNWKDRWVLFPQSFANETPEQLSREFLSREGMSGVLFPEAQLDVSKRNGFYATVTTGKSNAIVYQFVDDEQFRDFVSKLESNRNNTIMQAPKVTLFDGQMGEIADTTQRPFVTGVTKVVGDYGVVYQPVFKVLWEGSKIRLTPAVTPEGHHLRCKLMFASIDGCKAFTLRHERVSLQRPVVTTTTVECEVDIPTGQTLLIGGLFPQAVPRDADQGVFSRLLGMQPTKVFSEQVMFIAITPRTIVPE